VAGWICPALASSIRRDTRPAVGPVHDRTQAGYCDQSRESDSQVEDGQIGLLCQLQQDREGAFNLRMFVCFSTRVSPFW
jgi:hypothetical protein